MACYTAAKSSQSRPKVTLILDSPPPLTLPARFLMPHFVIHIWRDFLRPILLAVLLVVLFRSFVWEPFRIPSGSMEPNLLVGDFIFVSKWRYGYGPFSLPFLSLFVDHDSARMFGIPPRRGDMVVFRRPNNPGDILVKRVVGLPDDRVRVTGGRLEINGKKVARTELAHSMYQETLPNRVRYPILEAYGDNAWNDNTPLFRIPARHYFMMGDNRDNSLDSRIIEEVGFVPESHLVGPVVRVWFSLKRSGFFPFNIRWNRILRPITEIEARTIREHGR